MKYSIIVIILMSFSFVLQGQVYEAGIAIGGSNYIGDIGRTNYIYPNKIAGGVLFKYNWNPKIALRASYSYLPIEASDLDADTDFKRARGLEFKNTINELAIGFEYNFYEYDLSSEDKTWTPYILLELVGFNYTVYNNITSNEKSKNTLAIPFGVGIKSKLIGPLAIAFETKFRYTFDDDLDNSGSSFIGGNNSDWYVFTGISIMYTFGRPACYTNGL